MKIQNIIKPQMIELLGLTEKDMQVYLSLLRLGSAPLRKIAEASSLSRSTAYDALKRLEASGLTSYVDAKSHRYFVAEDPQKLRGLATRRGVALEEVRQKIDDSLPELRALIGEESHRPAVRYFEGESGIKEILTDVLFTTQKTKSKTYQVYSSSVIRDLISASWPKFTQKRISMGVRVKSIAIDKGGKTYGLDERRWLSQKDGGAPTYIFIYEKKTAYVAVDNRKQLFGVIIDDSAIASTQKMIFDALWNTLI